MKNKHEIKLSKKAMDEITAIMKDADDLIVNTEKILDLLNQALIVTDKTKELIKKLPVTHMREFILLALADEVKSKLNLLHDRIFEYLEFETEQE